MSAKGQRSSRAGMSARATCICQICNCGRHKCPQHPQRQSGGGGPCQISEYNQKYHAHPMVPVNSFKPQPTAVRSDGPISDETTNRIDFVPLPLEKPFVRKADAYRPPTGDFEDTTMYKKDFVEKRAPKVQSVRKEVNRGVPGRFEGEPTYKTDYRKWEMPPLERGNREVAWTPPKDAFGGIPTYQTDYIPHKIQMQASCRPDAVAMRSDMPLEGTTDYRQSYIKHPLEKRMEKEKEPYHRPNVPFEGMSTFTRDFTPKRGLVRPSMKPNAEAFQSGAPLASDTTMRTDFIPFDLDRPAQHMQEPYRKPEGEMDMHTTYLRDFHELPINKHTFKKPAERGRTLGPFEGTTEHQDNFRKWQMGPRIMAGPKGEYEGPNVPFEGLSTQKAHYVPHALNPMMSFKPTNAAAGNSGEFDGNTMYRMEYVPKMVEPCPAAILGSQSSRYIFRGQDETGHKFYESQGYQPQQQTMTDLSSGRPMVPCS